MSSFSAQWTFSGKCKFWLHFELEHNEIKKILYVADNVYHEIKQDYSGTCQERRARIPMAHLMQGVDFSTSR